MSRLLELMQQRMALESQGVAPPPKPRMFESSGAGGMPVTTSADFNRIKALPRRDIAALMTPEHVALLSDELRTSRGTMSLRPLQVAALIEAKRCNGLLGIMSVGSGKTLTAFLLPWVMGARTTVIFTTPKLVQPMKNEFARYVMHWKSDMASMHIIAYSKLSGSKSGDILDRIQPDLVILDESSSVKARGSVRTRRLMRFLKANPNTRVVPLSGTMTTRSLNDFEHLAHFALRDGSPVPHYWPTLQEWCLALDSDVKDFARRQPGVLREFMESEDKNVRDGFRRRLVATPGVVASSENELGTSLIYDKREVSLPVEAGVEIATLEKDWRRSDGEELMSALDVAAVARELSCGFFYKWEWPNGVVDEEWMRIRAEWHKEVRDFLKRGGTPGCDSPLLVYNACARGDLQFDSFEHWQLVKSRPTPPTVPVWISDFLVKDAVAWGKEAPGIIWYEHKAFGEAIAKAGLFAHYGAQSKGGADIEKEDGKRTIVVSIDSYFKGVNLQYAFCRNLVTTPPANGERWEQFVGRTHRELQKEDEVTVDVYLHTNTYRNALRKALDDASYAERVTGSKQKLLYGTKLWNLDV